MPPLPQEPTAYWVPRSASLQCSGKSEVRGGRGGGGAEALLRVFFFRFPKLDVGGGGAVGRVVGRRMNEAFCGDSRCGVASRACRGPVLGPRAGGRADDDDGVLEDGVLEDGGGAG